jgi:hypothetical protein
MMLMRLILFRELDRLTQRFLGIRRALVSCRQTPAGSGTPSWWTSMCPASTPAPSI